MIGIIIFSLFVLSIAFFFTDVPYFYFGILFITLSFLIVLIKSMWSISVKATDKIHQFFDERFNEASELLAGST